MTLLIDIIDYGVGNLKSVSNALSDVSDSVKICKELSDLRSSSRVVLPGVGAFKTAVDNLNSNGWTAVLEELRSNSRPVLGICLGFQLLHSRSHENGEHLGLNVFEGEIKNFADIPIRVSVPNIGWRKIVIKVNSYLLRGINEKDAFYFLHSYYADIDNLSTVATSNYGIDFSAVNQIGSFVGVQFHPEKSSNSGMKLLENFTSWSPSI